VKTGIAQLLLDIAEALKELCTLYFLTAIEKWPIVAVSE
jgi:hypothetical protein